MKQLLILLFIAISTSSAFAQQVDINEQLVLALKSSDIITAKKLIKKQADVSAIAGEDSVSAMFCLLYSVSSGDVSSRYYDEDIKERALLDLEKDEVFDLILLAIQNGYNVFISEPCEYNSEVIVVDQIGREYLKYVSVKIHLQAFDLIVENKRLHMFQEYIIDNINTDNCNEVYDKRKTALHYVCEKDSTVSIVQTLLNKGANPGAFDEDFCTPLHYAIHNADSQDITKLLLEENSNRGVENICSMPYGADSVSVDVMMYLLYNLSGEEFYDIDLSDFLKLENIGESEIFELIELLIQNGYNVFRTEYFPYDTHQQTYNESGYNELITIPSHIKLQAYREFIENDVLHIFQKEIIDNITEDNCNLTYNYGLTALHYVCEFDSTINIANELIIKGADVNAKDESGNTPLLYALSWDENGFDVARLLIENGADVNAKDKEGNTPLYYAKQNENGAEIVEYLLENGAE